jgi:hypothetical protein
MSVALQPKNLKVLFSNNGAPKWVIEPGAGGDNNGMHVVVRKGQTVQWKGKDGHIFTIRFVNPATGTPFSDWTTQSKESPGDNPNVVTGTVSNADDTDVVYKYNVEVVGHDALDPAIIMDK